MRGGEDKETHNIANPKYIGSCRRKIECYCPRCEKTYHRTIHWEGQGVPRIYCHECKLLDDLSPEPQWNPFAKIKRGGAKIA